jgi:hypothetical protein
MRGSRFRWGSALPTLSKPLLVPILENESLTRGLGDPEARILIEWLVDEAEVLAKEHSDSQITLEKVARLCLRGRAIGRFVWLWCYGQAHGPAGQLAAAERFHWPLPDQSTDPCEVMQSILIWESEHPQYR